jgi:hypothetical protein
MPRNPILQRTSALGNHTSSNSSIMASTQSLPGTKFQLPSTGCFINTTSKANPGGSDLSAYDVHLRVFSSPGLTFAPVVLQMYQKIPEPDRLRYQGLFSSLKPKTSETKIARVSTEVLVDVWKRSRLSYAVLADLWQELYVTKKSDHYSNEEFCVGIWSIDRLLGYVL